MKKQIGLIALTALLVSFVAFSGVASAQASSTQIVLFTSPYCSVCQKVDPIVHSVAANNPGVTFAVYDVTQESSGAKGVAQANGVSSTPTIIISKNGQQVFRSEGREVTANELQAAIGTVTVVKAATTPIPTAKPVVKAATTPIPTAKPVVKAAVVVKATATPTATKTVVKTVAQPSIEVVTATQTPTTSTQTVPEFSLLGLGAPALVVGAIYLFLRRR